MKDKEKKRAYNKEYYRKNKEKIIAQNKKYYYENWDKCKEDRKAYKRSDNYNRDKYRQRDREYIKEWREKNPSSVNEQAAKRRADKKKACPSWSEVEKIKIVYRKAKELSKLLDKEFHVDHIIPLNGKNVCGLHVWNNLQILEGSLNIRKSNKF